MRYQRLCLAVENGTVKPPNRHHRDIAKDTRLGSLKSLLKSNKVSLDSYYSSVCNEYEFEPKKKSVEELSDTEDEGSDTDEE